MIHKARIEIKVMNFHKVKKSIVSQNRYFVSSAAENWRIPDTKLDIGSGHIVTSIESDSDENIDIRISK